MKSLQEILKANGQNPSQAYQTGKLEFDKTAGGLVYRPPGVNNSERKSFQVVQGSKNERRAHGSF